MNSTLSLLLLHATLSAAWLASAALRAADPAPAPTEHTHRVSGLFAPEREAALRIALEKLPGVTLVRLDREQGEAVFAYDPAAAFPGTKPEPAELDKRFDERLREASRHTLGILPPCPTPHDRRQCLEIPVAGQDCQACALATYESIYKIDGLIQASVSYREGKVTALIDPEKTNRAALVTALKARGVDVTEPAGEGK